MCGHREVLVAVAVEVGHGDLARVREAREALAGLEGAVALADADVHDVDTRIGDREVLPAVAVEVADGRTCGSGCGAGARPELDVRSGPERGVGGERR